VQGSPRLTNLPDVNRQDTMDTGDDDLASAVMNGGVGEWHVRALVFYKWQIR
jgi:hypothetical protein